MGTQGTKTVNISSLLKKEQILFLDAKSREEACTTLAEALDQGGHLPQLEEFEKALLEREKIISTGIGMGVAIPHAKLSGFSDFCLAIGIQKAEGIDWDALDGSHVHLIFMIGGPADRQTDYLKILSRLTGAIKDEKRRSALLKCQTAEDVIQQFEGC